MQILIRIYKALRDFIRHHWLTAAFLFGFILDTITLNRVDQVFDNIVLFSYVILAMTSILLLYSGVAERYSDRVNLFLRKKAPLLMQYSFGGLLSGMLIFYGRGGSFSESWPFIFLILSVIYGNETIKDRAGRLVYNLVIFFVGLFAYVVLVVPVALAKMGPMIFVGSGFLALFIMYMFLRTLEKIVPNFIRLQKRNIVFIIGLIYVSLNFLYFTNIIPPIPLSLKDVGIYHNVTHVQDGSYELTYEKPKWWVWYRDSDSSFHYSSGGEVYCYASVFAPARLVVDIYHRWEYYNEVAGEWVQHYRIAYPISGGRGEGYRGYTSISAYQEGKWRCIVETGRGQVIGKETFTIVSGMQGELMSRTE
ncbi:MAG: DUF2914 domain-containing protein [Candidatus Pacebacteria bacterium]|nr:DUF2914 domain-containing protein [Candidatus Paceibacterota bacterium]